MFSILQYSKSNNYRFRFFDDTFNLSNIRQPSWLKDRVNEIKLKGIEKCWWIPVLIDEKE